MGVVTQSRSCRETGRRMKKDSILAIPPAEMLPRGEGRGEGKREEIGRAHV